MFQLVFHCKVMFIFAHHRVYLRPVWQLWAILSFSVIEMYPQETTWCVFCCPPLAVLSSEEQRSDLESQLKTYEWQLKILHAVLTASGDQERDQLLKDHPGDICTLVYSITEKVENPFMSLKLLHIVTPPVNLISDDFFVNEWNTSLTSTCSYMLKSIHERLVF